MISYNRFRQLDEAYVPSCVHTVRFMNHEDKDVTNNDYATAKSLGTRQCIFDTHTRGFKPGALSINECDIRKISCTCTGGTLSMIKRPYSNTLGDDVFVGPLLASAGSTLGSIPNGVVSDSKKDDLALMKAYAVTAKPTVEVGIAIAEVRDTVRMLMSPSKALSKGLKRFLAVPPNIHSSRIVRTWRDIKAEVARNTRYGRYLADKWLGTRFGLLPLISDVHDVFQYAQKKTDTSRLPPFYTARGSAVEVSDTYSTSTRLLGSFRLYSNVHRQTLNGSHSGWYYKQYMEPMAQSLFDFGLHPRQALRTIWEIIPFSFLVDEVVNVGDWLEGLNPYPDVDIIMGWVTTVSQTTETETFDHATYFASAANPYIKCTGSIMQTIMHSMSRRRNLTIPSSPGLQLNIVDLTRSIDALAILWQKLR